MKLEQNKTPFSSQSQRGVKWLILLDILTLPPRVSIPKKGGSRFDL